MITHKPRSLRRQLLIWLLTLLIPLLLIGTIYSYYRVNHFANLAYDRSLKKGNVTLDGLRAVARGASQQLFTRRSA